MKYHLYSLGLKAVPKLTPIAHGTRGAMGVELTARRTVGNEEYGIYDDRGVLVSSTASGGASPHAWGLRAAGKGRKQAGLPEKLFKN